MIIQLKIINNLMSNFISDLISLIKTKGSIVLFGLFQTVILARWLGPEKNGILMTLLVYPSIFISFGSLGLMQSTAFFTGKKTYDEFQIKRALSQIWIFTSLLGLLISFYLIVYFTNSGNNILLVILAILPIPFTLFNGYNSGVFLGKNQIKKFNKIKWLPRLIVLILIIILVVFLKLSINGALIALIFGPLLMSGIMLYKNQLINSFSLKIELKVLKDLLSLGSVYALALLVINLNYKIDILFLDKLSNSYEAGIYGVGVTLVQNLWQIPTLLGALIFARSSNSKNNYEFSLKVAQLLRISILVVAVVSIVFSVLAKKIIVLLYGIEFEGSSFVAIYILPGVFLLTINKVLNQDMAGRGKPWISLKAMIPALFFNIVLNFFLIPIYGAKGAACASTISYSVAAILFLVFYSKQVSIPIRTILSYKKSDFDPIIQLIKKI